MEIFPDIQIISGIASRLYLIRDVDGFTMIDAGLRLDAGRIIHFLEKHIQEPGQANPDPNHPRGWRPFWRGERNNQ